MKKNKRRKTKFTKGERFIYSIAILSLVSIFVMKVFFGASISNLKMNIEKINYKIELQKNKNESLNMQVNELTSYENLDSILKEMGLAYNNENIIVIDEP